MEAADIIQKLAEYITSHRIKHSINTRDIALNLAERYGIDRNRVEIASLLHDCARDIEENKLLDIAQNEGLSYNEVEYKIPVLLHGPVGAVIARKNFHIKDIHILRAISVHTAGAREMSSVDKVVFIADKIEPGRNYPNVQKLREKAYKDLDECLIACFDNSIEYSLERNKLMPLQLCEARNGLLMEAEKKQTIISKTLD